MWRLTITFVLFLAPVMLTDASAPALQLAYLHPLSDMTHCDQVMVIDVDGTVNQQFDMPIINGCMPPLWSPDGQYLVVYHPGMTIINIETGVILVLNDLTGGILFDTPVWSRDGNYIAWHEHRGGDGRNPTWKVLNVIDGMVETHTSLSEAKIEPDQIQLLYVESESLFSVVSGAEPQKIALPQKMNCTSTLAWHDNQFLCIDADDLVLIDTQSGATLNLTNTPDVQESNAHWSPDKTQIVFETFDPMTRKSWINTISSTGTNVQQLTLPPDDSYDVLPLWSPDAQYIAFQRHNGYKGLSVTVNVIRADGTELQSIGDGIYPVWRPVS